MKANAPEKICVKITHPISDEYTEIIAFENGDGIEYVRADAFIEKAKKWFEQQPETYDANGVRVYGEEDFEDFRKYMEGE